jgi:glycosyltransferase involved in cell wall biosynthesis
MRILYFSQSYTIHDYRFLEALGKSEHEIYFLQLEDEGLLQEKRSLPSGVTKLYWARKSRQIDFPDDLTASIEEFAKIVEQIRPDVVHAGPIHSCTYIAAAAKTQQLLAASWGSDLLIDADRTQALHDRACFALNHAEMLLADCDEVTEKAHALTGFPYDRIVQFPWGVDLDVFRPGVGEAGIRSQFDSDAFILLSTRRWETNFGILDLLDAFLEAYQAIPQLSLLLLGDGSLRSEIEAFVSRNRLSRVVRMPGQIPGPSLPDYYRAANLYVSCTLSDGSSISLLEAMATGLPVVATDRPSNREWINEDSGGLLVKFGDSSAVRNAIVQIASMGTSKRNEWGNWNLAIARERADWKKNFQKLLAGYERIRGQALRKKSKS